MSKGRDFIEQLRNAYRVGCGAHDGRLLEVSSNKSGVLAALNLTHPELVRRIHAEYVDAGAHLIATNTTVANAVYLGRYGFEAKVREINLAGARLALDAAGRQACVAGSVGPLGLTLEEDWDINTLYEAYRGHIGALLEGGVHLIQLEFFTNLEELLLAVEQAKDLGGSDIPVMAQMVFADAGRVESGDTAATIARSLADAGADIIGVHCGRNIAGTVRAAEQLAAVAGTTPVAAYPNAGYPEAAEGRIVYMAAPAYMAETALKMAKAGVRLLGGCCGTTPEIIRAIALSLNTIRPHKLAASAAPLKTESPAPPPSFKAGGFLRSLRYSLPIIAEIDPPAHLLYRPMIDDARATAEAGADAISLAENPLASLKMGNMAIAAIIRREIGIQAICHVTCRDRNILGLQSALMGAYALGIESILAITGDPLGPSGGAGRSVFDLNSFTLVRLLAGLNRGVNHAGAPLKGETDFSIGVAFNSAARNLASEEQRLRRKLAEGAVFVMTQPVFDAEHAERVLALTRATGARVFLGFFPLVSARSALYLHNEVPGIKIPEPVLQRLTRLESKGDQEKAGLEMAGELLAALADKLDGVYLISPHNRARVLAPLIRMIRSWPQGSRQIAASQASSANAAS